MVADVENYPVFINLISALRVTHREQISDNHQRFKAEAAVSYKFLSENFGCIVDVNEKDKVIRVSKGDRSGAVKDLSNSWKFYELSDGSTLIDFTVLVKLKAFPLEIMLRDVFDRAALKIMNAFEARADQLYQKIETPDLDVEKEAKALGFSQSLS